MDARAYGTQPSSILLHPFASAPSHGRKAIVAHSLYPSDGRCGVLRDFCITGGRALVGDALEDASVHVSAADGAISEVGADVAARTTLDADGLLVLPGIVDIHGDAFERQMMPRPGVDVATDVALIESDRQAVANGITTVFHGVTWSWEPGLRGAENARGILDTIEGLRHRFAADTRFHLRHETFNLAAEDEVAEWIVARRIHAVAFNDHMPSADSVTYRPDKLAQMVARSGLAREDFFALVERLRARADEVPQAIARIAARANAAGVPLLSHDDASPEQRRWFRALGCRISEFPMTVATAREAADAGDSIVLGAPNVMRGKSHMGWIDATRMIADGLCSVLASDYFYPAPLIAAFRLADIGVLPLARAWSLVSAAPARAAGLRDRGRIERGLRADLILVDAAVSGPPQVVGVVADGRLVHLTECERLGEPRRLRAPVRAGIAQ
jgi:alpha-D-ribose 1-methylphosphonate 5-triphosphate diphosphatase